MFRHEVRLVFYNTCIHVDNELTLRMDPEKKKVQTEWSQDMLNYGYTKMCVTTPVMNIACTHKLYYHKINVAI